jgi:hypothetical protein
MSALSQCSEVCPPYWLLAGLLRGGTRAPRRGRPRIAGRSAVKLTRGACSDRSGVTVNLIRGRFSTPACSERGGVLLRARSGQSERYRISGESTRTRAVAVGAAPFPGRGQSEQRTDDHVGHDISVCLRPHPPVFRLRPARQTWPKNDRPGSANSLPRAARISPQSASYFSRTIERTCCPTGVWRR